MAPDLRRGELYWIDWSPGRGSEQAGRRPGLVVQTDAGNRNPRHPNIIVVAVSTSGRPSVLHVEVEPSTTNGLSHVSYVRCEQIQTVSRERLQERVGHVEPERMAEVDAALRRVLALG